MSTIAAWLTQEASRTGPGGWVCIAVPPSQLDSLGVMRLRRAGFSPTVDDPAILIRKTAGSGRSLALMLEALLGAHRVPGLSLAIISADDELDFDVVEARLLDFDRAIARLKAEWVIPIIVGKRIFTELQPVFDEHGNAFAEEALVRAHLPTERPSPSSSHEYVGGNASRVAALSTSAHGSGDCKADGNWSGNVAAAPILEAAAALHVVPEIDRLAHRAALSGLASLGRRVLLHAAQRSLVMGQRFVSEVLRAADLGEVEPARIGVIAHVSHERDLEAVRETLAMLSQVGIHSWVRVAVLERRASDLGQPPALEISAHGVSRLARVLADVQPEVVRLTLPALGPSASTYASNDSEHPWSQDNQAVLEQLAKAITGAGARLALTGIETEEQLAFAKRLGATYLSGWLLGAPRLAAELAAESA